jgi:hypothetical protein
MEPLALELEAALTHFKTRCALYEEAGVKANPLAREGAKVDLAVCKLLISIYNYDAIKRPRRAPGTSRS